MYKLILFLLVLFSFPLFAGSKCQLEWDALKSVQNQLRQKSYEWLREKERRKHKDYQACRKGKNREKAQSRSTRTSQNYNNQVSNINGSNHISNYRAPRTQHKTVINIKGYFKGEKQNDWLKYYREVKPKYCNSPKSTSEFAKCLNNEKEEVEKFKILWRMRNPDKEAPSSIVLGHG